MNRFRSIVLAATLLVVGIPAMANEGQGHPMGGGKSVSVTGEVVDLGCWLGHAARGEKHIPCATKCLNQGMPMGLLTGAGKLYLVTLDHDDADPYVGLKGMAGKTVTVTGAVLSRSGMTAIEASKIQPAGK